MPAFDAPTAFAVWDADEIHRIVKNDEQVWSTAMAWNALMFGGLDPRKKNAGMLMTLDFDEHRAARKILQPGFTTGAIEGYLRTADRIVAETIGAWTKRGHLDFKKSRARFSHGWRARYSPACAALPSSRRSTARWATSGTR